MDHTVSQQYRIYQLEEIRIKAGRTLDELIERIQGLADKCDFPTDAEKEQHIKSRLVCALSDTDLVRKLLAMKMEATTAEMLATCHMHIAIADNMSLMGLTTKVVNAIQKVPRKTQSDNCTKPHAPGWQPCPVKDSTCNYCQKVEHWRIKCIKSKKTVPGSKKLPKLQHPPHHYLGGKKTTDEVGVSEGDPHYDEISIQAWLGDQKSPKDPEEITCRHFHWCNDRNLCKCGDACCIKEESQPSMQGGHWCRRKCDAPSSLWKTLPKSVNKSWTAHRTTAGLNATQSSELTVEPIYHSLAPLIQLSPERMRKLTKFTRWTLLSMSPKYLDQQS